MAASNIASKQKADKLRNASILGSRVNGFPGENEFKDLQFKLTYSLQTTIDVTDTLGLFFDNIQALFAVDGIVFEDKEGANITLGVSQPHSAVYNVAANKTKLGRIEFKRGKPFLETELAVLEMLIGVLFYPLRNALLYRQALQNSMRDPLTGLGNRQAMQTCFKREIKLAQRHKLPLSLVLVDIDNFKATNDKYGHLNGDKVIRHTVSNIKKTLRETDQTFRFGGEEFVVLLHNTNSENAKLTAERIRMLVALTPLAFEKENILSTISLGVTQLVNTDSTESFFERADSALYMAKNAGRNKVVVK